MAGLNKICTAITNAGPKSKNRARFHFSNMLCVEKPVLTLVIYDRGMFTCTKVKFYLKKKKKKKKK